MKLKIAYIMMTVAIFGAVSAQTLSMDKGNTAKLPQIENEVRIEHAKELLGSSYDESEVQETESSSDLNAFILKKVKALLPAKSRFLAFDVAQAILKESETHQFDPIFIMAVIAHESVFNPSTIGGVGEIGLMQVRPETAKWLAEKIGMKWNGKGSLFSPTENIKFGTAYLAMLRKTFKSNGTHYLAAYNMGTTNVKRSLMKRVTPKAYAGKVMTKYFAFYGEFAGAAKQNVALNQL